MPEDKISESIFSYAGKAGYEVRIISSANLKELEEEFENMRSTDGFNEDFCYEQLTSFNFSPSDKLHECNSIILFAVPQPITLLLFRFDGIDQHVYIPPGYDTSVDSLIENDLKEILTCRGTTIERDAPRLKLLAVRSGMAEYGRNNMCYIPGKGSYFRFIAFYSDLANPDATWRSKCLMERCKTCKACISACPTGAIDENRFPLHSELCISFHNGRAGNFPDFIKPSYHHCLLGCLKCQNVCPENKHDSERFEIKEEFSEYETLLLMNDKPLNAAPISMRMKLERLNLIRYYSFLSRNLRHCLVSH